MTVKSLLAEHLRHVAESEAWQPALFATMDGLTAEQAAWTPVPGRHSIWQIVRHMTHWKRFLLELWDGGRPNADDWEHRDWAPASGDESAWARDVNTLRAVYREIGERVAELPERELASTFADWKQPLAMALTDMGTHDAYHAGQIRLLRALQGLEG